MMDVKNLEDNFKFENDYWWFLGRRRIIVDLVRRFLPSGNGPLRALDAGCATASITREIEKYASTVGVDYLNEALVYARQRGNKNLVRGDVCDLPFRDGSFDLATILGVLYNEGVRSDGAAIAELFRVLKPGGILIIDESAYDFLQSNHNVSWGGVRRYTSTQLVNKAEKRGFKILKASYYCVLLLPVVYLAIKLEKVLKLKEKKVYKLSKVPGFINHVLKGYLYLEAALLKRFNLPFGTMVFVVAKKI